MAKIIKKNRGSDLTMTKEQEAIKYFKKHINYFKEQIKFIEAVDCDYYNEEYELYKNRIKQFETVLSMIEKKDRRLNRQFKLLMKKDREIEQKNKQIELISEKLAKAYHYKVNKCSLKEKEQNNIDCDKYKDCTSCVKQYFKNQSKLFKYNYNKKSTLDINSNAKI